MNQPRPSNPRLEAGNAARERARSPECRAAGRCVCGGCAAKSFEAGMNAIRAYDVRAQMRESVRRMNAVVAARRPA
jgi:hypothetical protein